MTDASRLPRLATHGGKFHCDEIFAYAVLRLALGLHTPGLDHDLIRTRKQELLDSADIVFDVGSVFDTGAKRFDHHQRGAPLRPDGAPYSAAGLIWQVYGQDAVAAILRPKRAEAFAPAIAAKLDEGLIRRLDEIDTGVSLRGPIQNDSLGLAALLGDFNPTWDDEAGQGNTAGDDAFFAATEMAAGVLTRRVDIMRAKLAAEEIVLTAHKAGPDPRILVLDRGMPWKNVVFTHHLPVLFTISPASNGNWMVDTMPPEPNSFDQLLPLPEAWAGLQGADLAAASGVEDAVFVHLRRFVGAAKSREGAIALATITIKESK
jgi:uncharacterized UPF0160 family protein